VERLREHLASIGTERERERQQLIQQIEDLRRRLDQLEQERRDKDRQLTALLTDQRERAAPAIEGGAFGSGRTRARTQPLHRKLSS